MTGTVPAENSLHPSARGFAAFSNMPKLCTPAVEDKHLTGNLIPLLQHGTYLGEILPQEKFRPAFSFLPWFLTTESSSLLGSDREEVTSMGIEVEEANSRHSLGCGTHCADSISCFLGKKGFSPLQPLIFSEDTAGLTELTSLLFFPGHRSWHPSARWTAIISGTSGQVRVAHLGNSSSAGNLAGLGHKLRVSEAGRRMSRSHWKLGSWSVRWG